MKKLVFLFCAGMIAISGCGDVVTETVTYQVNEPVFMSAKDFRGSVVVSTKAQPITDYGKICFYDGHIYISETGKGVHIINNTIPSRPQNVGFIELLGNADLAIRNGKLYADAYIDLVWFDITNPEKPKLEGRLENVFQDALPPTENDYGIDYQYRYGYDCSKGVIVGWKVKTRKENVTYRNGGTGGAIFPDQVSNSGFDYATGSSERTIGGGSMGNGVNGSMSRFALYQDYLYTVINNYMSILDLSGGKPVKAADNLHIGWDVETIFSYKDNMFMGTPRGMVIYSVANPLQPQYISSVWHVFGCDPVVVENDIAYVTINSGNGCGQNTNELIIYDVSNVETPQHIVTYAMTKPKGLGVDRGTLFLCDDGLKIFNATDPKTLMAHQLAHYKGMSGYDVIPFENVLMMIAEDGLYQYHYSDLDNIKQLSKLPFTKKK